jgi:hypothetical protein
MTTIAGLNNFNNLLYSTRKIAIANQLEHKAGRTPLDLSYKKPKKLMNCLIVASHKSMANIKI